MSITASTEGGHMTRYEVIANDAARGLLPGFGGRIAAALVWDGTDEVRIPSAMGQPSEGQMVGTARERVVELAGRVCFDPETEVLTREGWIRFDALPRGAEVATFNRETEKMEFQEPTDYIRKRYKGRMYRARGTKVSLFTTPDHELFVGNRLGRDWSLKKAESIEGACYALRRQARYEASVVEPIVMKGRSYQQKNANKHAVGRIVTRTVPDEMIDIHQLPAWATLLGYYVSEGTLNMHEGGGSAPVVALYQKQANMQPILDAAEGCGLRPRIAHIDARSDVAQIRVGGSTLARYLLSFGKGSRNKRLPGYVFEWPASLRETLLDALMAGDGTVTKNNVRVYNTNSKGLADDVQRLMISLGRAANINYSVCETCVMYRVRETKQDHVTVNKHRKQDSFVDYHGEVFCVSVPNRILFTRRDDKVALCGNCYDSLGSGRASPDYHANIIKVNHGALHEHAVFTIEVSGRFPESAHYYLNKPCLYARPTKEALQFSDLSWKHFGYRVTCNLRHAREWGKDIVGDDLRTIGHRIAPLIVPEPGVVQSESVRLVEPETDEEKWITLYVSGSRGWSHELVRHGDWTAISQRSTRYVDECESEWVMHPLLAEFQKASVHGLATDVHTALGVFIQGIETQADGIHDSVSPSPRERVGIIRRILDEMKEYASYWQNVAQPGMVAQEAKIAYLALVRHLQPWLEAKGIDKFSARKQARGAARGLLGNALETEVIFSASVAQWRHMLNMRAADAADAEIRLGFAEAVLPCLRASRYGDRFKDFELAPAKDGIGRSLAGGGAK